MIRTANQAQQFLTWIGEVPYMVTWTPGTEMGEMAATLAGDFNGAADWRQAFPVEAVDDIGLETWAMQIAATHHAAARP